MNSENWLFSHLLEWMAFGFMAFLGVFSLVVLALFIIDIRQTTHAVRRNYPVVGRFRYLFETLGEFFRQYFFAMDREEMPFNRAKRAWVYRAAKDLNNTVAFGSTRDLRSNNTLLFVNCPFPTLNEDAAHAAAVTIGEHSLNPYTTSGLLHISGMSYGAISKPAVQALSHGAKQAGIWLNCGEGAISPYHLEGGADLVFQIGTAKYGVRDANGNLSAEKLREIAAIDAVKMFEIKLSQGAKPGKGGILPASKVTPEIARIRGIPINEASISPNRHVDIANLEQLLDRIEFIKQHTQKPVGFKIVIGAYGWLDELCVLIHKRGLNSAPDFITIDSADGGTGAAPMSLMDYMGLPIRESLPLADNILRRHQLRNRIKLIASGKLINPGDIAWALCAGADFIVTARGFMFALGCIQAMQCNQNSCPTGITTHNKKLQRGLNPELKANRVANYVKNLEHEVELIAHSCGVRHPRELKRFHARLVGVDGKSRGLDEVYPYP